MTIWALTVYLIVEAVKRLFDPPDRFNPPVMLITACFGVFANLMMGVAIYGWKIIGLMWSYMIKGDDATSISDGKTNMNIRAVMAHIQGKNYFCDKFRGFGL